MKDNNAKFSISLDFDPESDKAPGLWKAIAGLIVACAGEDEARSMMAEAQAKLMRGEPVKVRRVASTRKAAKKAKR